MVHRIKITKLSTFIISILVILYVFSSPYNNVCNRLSHQLDGSALNSDLLSKINVTSTDEVTTDASISKTKILCWIISSPANHRTRAKHALHTWGKRCDKTMVMSSVEDESMNAVSVTNIEGKDNLWQKTRKSLKYLYDNHLNDAEWFMKADDDTYVIVENLRFMLQPYNSSFPIWFGKRYRIDSRLGFMAGGGGYVISREAVKRFVEYGLTNKNCKANEVKGREDVELAICLGAAGVSFGDSRDSEGRERFTQYSLQSKMAFIPRESPRDMTTMKKYSYYRIMTGYECCSREMISFHYVKPYEMYDLEFLLYHLRPHGAKYSVSPRPLPPPDKTAIPPGALRNDL